MLSMEQIRAALKDEGNSESRPNNYYPFWNMQYDQQVIIRFLPDTNEDNPKGFLVEKRYHTLNINGENKNIPCLTMYGEDCPICKVSSDYYKKEDKTNGKKYWRKRQHITQALIIEDPLPANDETGETHEGKVRMITLGYQLFNIIKESIEGGELDVVPCAYEGGTDFVIKKTKQGEYATYAIGSRFVRKSTDLTDEQLAIAQEGMVDLGTLLPQHPGEDKISAMLHAALTNQAYEEDGDSDKAPALEVKTPAETPAATSSVEETEDSGSSDVADDIIAQIRNRNRTTDAE